MARSNPPSQIPGMQDRATSSFCEIAFGSYNKILYLLGALADAVQQIKFLIFKMLD
jgi:hypothetical protein